MNILVTGAAGFIAFHLIKKLLEDQHNILGIDNFISGQKENIEELCKNDNFTFKNFDVIDFKKEHLNYKIDEIYHLACPASPQLYQKKPLHTLDTCYIGTKNMLEIAKEHNAKILIASTSEVYGDPDQHPQPESYRGNVNTYGPRACYDEGKRISETLAFEYLKEGVYVRTARIFNTYGSHMSAQDGRVVINFIIQALSNKNLTVFGDGSQTRAFCFITDLIRGLMKLMHSSVETPINLGSADEFTILHLAKVVSSIINPNLQVQFFPLPEDDPKKRKPDLSMAKQLLNWQPSVSLEDGIKFITEYYQKNNKYIGRFN